MKKLLFVIALTLTTHTFAQFTAMTCEVYEGPTLLKVETTVVNDRNQSTIDLGVFSGVNFAAYSLDEFVVVYAKSPYFEVNTTGNMSSFLVVYNREEFNKDLSVSCELK